MKNEFTNELVSELCLVLDKHIERLENMQRGDPKTVKK